jgi:hypothetical protein
MSLYQSYLESEISKRTKKPASEFIALVSSRLYDLKKADPSIHYTVGIPKEIKLSDEDKKTVVERFKKEWPEARFYTTAIGQPFFILKK